MMSMSPKVTRVRLCSEIILNAGKARLSRSVRFDKLDLRLCRENLFFGQLGPRPSITAVGRGGEFEEPSLLRACTEASPIRRRSLLNLRGIFLGRGKRLSFMDNEVLPICVPAYHAADIKYVTRLLAVTKLPSKFRGRSRSKSSAPNLGQRLRK